MRTAAWIPALVILVTLGAGCQARLGGMTVAATGGVRLSELDLDAAPQTERVTGVDSKFWFLFIPIPLGPFNYQKAIDDALEKGEGDVMVDVVFYHRWWWFLVGRSSIEAEGNVVKTRGGTR